VFQFAVVAVSDHRKLLKNKGWPWETAATAEKMYHCGDIFFVNGAPSVSCWDRTHG